VPSRFLSTDETRDLGFGPALANASRTRLMNRDGSYNVVREGLSPLASLNLYHYLLTVSWPRFLAMASTAYLLVNGFFAVLYVLAGEGALGGVHTHAAGDRYLAAFFFSVHTFATIGYGSITPVTLAANLIVTVESLVGLLGFAVGTGVVFSRFSRPTARILFSRRAIIAPYRGITAFEFRLVNGRSSQIIEMHARLTMNRLKSDGSAGREFFELELEREHVPLLPMSWTIVHPIDERSPLYGVTEEQLHDSDAEFFILLTGVDETFAQQVHARRSYKPDEVEWGARFTTIMRTTESGVVAIDVSRIDERTPAELPSSATPTTVPLQVGAGG
jgi:inward rectifier potassium channel